MCFSRFYFICNGAEFFDVIKRITDNQANDLKDYDLDVFGVVAEAHVAPAGADP